MIKRLSIIFILSLFVLPIFSQITQVYAADMPITAPISSFNLSGKVTYKKIGRLMQNAERFMPAKNVIVTIVGFFDRHQRYTTSTDAEGKYQVNIPDGLYQVEVRDTMHTFFVPPIKVERISSSVKKTANFEGLVFNF